MTLRNFEDSPELIRKRKEMVEHQIRARGIKDEALLAAMERVPRHLFVPEGMRGEAYEDYPLPIGHGQTISQPYIVALMTELLKVKQGHKILEIGTGSGYQTAILLEMGAEVCSIERVPELAEEAERRLRALGYSQFKIKVGDGTLGWPEEAPFDGIIVTAGAPSIPDPLKSQLKKGGRLVIPVGDRLSQDLMVVVRENDHFEVKNMGACRFVSLIGKYGWEGE